MQLKIKANFKENLDQILRDCGYRLHPKYENSYIKRLSSTNFYPRWHLYIENKNNIYYFNLHLDQKKASYEGQKAHSGDYEDNIVKEEAKRIIGILKKYV